jgi:hypothetical protein
MLCVSAVPLILACILLDGQWYRQMEFNAECVDIEIIPNFSLPRLQLLEVRDESNGEYVFPIQYTGDK